MFLRRAATHYGKVSPLANQKRITLNILFSNLIQWRVRVNFEWQNRWLHELYTFNLLTNAVCGRSDLFKSFIRPFYRCELRDCKFSLATYLIDIPTTFQIGDGFQWRHTEINRCYSCSRIAGRCCGKSSWFTHRANASISILWAGKKI